MIFVIFVIFNRGAPCLKNVQWSWNFGIFPFLRCINRISPSVINFRKKISTHPIVQPWQIHKRKNRKNLKCTVFIEKDQAIKLWPLIQMKILNLTTESHLWIRSVESLVTSGTTGCAPMCTANEIQQKPLHTLGTMHTPIQIKHTRKNRHLYTSLQFNTTNKQETTVISHI